MVSHWLPTLKPRNADPTNSTLPPSPRELITHRVVYEMPLLDRRVNSDSDTPLKALYRNYEHIVLDQWAEIRNEFEAFWFHSSWAVRDIPDPKDPDPERYSCLACIPKLLCIAFNERIKIGLPRDAPAIFTGDMMEEWKKREPEYEEWPPWVEEVSPVSNPLNGTKSRLSLSQREIANMSVL